MSSPKRIRYSSNEETSQDGGDLGLQKALEEIEIFQKELEALADQENKEVVKVLQKFHDEKLPIYSKREYIIRQIPNFWITALLNHPDIKIHESEEDCLSNLTHLEVQNFNPVDSGYSITFHFKENPYFENSFITKDYKYKLMDYNGPAANITHTPIMWKVGDEVYTKFKEHKSFFWWLSCYDDGTLDIETAEIIRDDLWVNPLQYYLISDAANSDEDEDSEDVIIIEDEDEDKHPEMWGTEADYELQSSPESAKFEND